MNDLTIRTMFAVLPTDPTAVKRMPTIMDNHFLPDMGRMTPR
jgi:hypothetical protein